MSGKIKEVLNKDSKEFKDEYTAILKKHDGSIADLNIAFNKLKIEIDQQLIKNNQEYADKLFEILSAFKKLEERITKEINELKEILIKDNKEFKDEHINILKKHDTNFVDLNISFDRLKIEVDQKLIKNNQEYSDKLFELMSAFLRWNKEISLVSFLDGREPDLKKLRMEENWSKTNAEQAEKINKALESKGEKVRQVWNKYKDEKLTLEREEKDTKLVDSKLEILNILMEGIE